MELSFEENKTKPKHKCFKVLLLIKVLLLQYENEKGSGNRFGGLQVVTEPVEGDSVPRHTPSRPSMYSACPDQYNLLKGFPPYFEVYAL